MGSFGGHALPGSFFIFWSIWWTIKIFYRFYMAKINQTRFTTSSTFNLVCFKGKLKRWPFEGALKIFLVTVAAIIEIITAFDEKGKFYLGNAQHATMFMFFAMNGVIDILLYFRVSLPPTLDYVSLALAFTVEFLLFKFHLHGRQDLDVLIHTLLLYLIIVTIAVILVEMKFRHNVLISLSRSYLVLLQGLWFWQVAFILYNPAKPPGYWDQENHENIILATLYFTWHAAVAFILILVIGTCVKFFVRCRNGKIPDDIENREDTNLTDNQYTQLSLLNDIDSDLEFEKPVVRNKVDAKETTFNNISHISEEKH